MARNNYSTSDSKLQEWIKQARDSGRNNAHNLYSSYQDEGGQTSEQCLPPSVFQLESQ